MKARALPGSGVIFLSASPVAGAQDAIAKPAKQNGPCA
jgi:hypothetical protein